MRIAALLLVAGCGRLEFDPRSDAAVAADAPTGHDEDGDGLVDAVDPCPHVAGDTADEDGDGVGDACDPNPSTPSESFLVFATLQPGDHPFRSNANLVQEEDGLRFTGMNAGLWVDRPVTNVRIELGFEIHALVGTGQHQVASGVEGVVEPYYFVELNENGPVRDAGIVSYDGVNGYVFLGSATHPGMHPGRGVLRYDASVTAGTHVLVAGWTDELYNASGATPAYTGGPTTRITLNGLDVSLLYFVAIQTL